MKMVAPVLGALPTAFFHVLLGAAGLAAILLALGVARDFRGKLRAALLLGVINSGIPFLMYSIAAQLLPAGYSAIFNATTPMMGVLIGGLIGLAVWLVLRQGKPATAATVGVPDNKEFSFEDHRRSDTPGMGAQHPAC
jgi:drug/metabolite transporter (DMT)-like permease